MKTTVKHCARCDGDHFDLEINQFTHPVLDDERRLLFANYWAMCPDLNEPILIQVVEYGKVPQESS